MEIFYIHKFLYHHKASFNMNFGNKSIWSFMQTMKKNLPLKISKDQEFAKLVKSDNTWPSTEEWNGMTRRLFNEYFPEV